MRCKLILWTLLLGLLPTASSLAQVEPQTRTLGNIALVNGQWFNGTAFDTKAMYSLDGRFSSVRPARIDRTLDLNGAWIVPPFAEAHNHNLGSGMPDRDSQTIKKYLADGVFYVQIQGNQPLSDDDRRTLAVNRPNSVDAIFAQGSQQTGSGGHPIRLVENLLPLGVYKPGTTLESFPNRAFFIVDSEADLDQHWPVVLAQHPDFIKVMLLHSEEFALRKDDPNYYGIRGLNPELLPKVVAKAHAGGLRVSVHVDTAVDFHHAVTAGVDMIAHLPLTATTPIAEQDARDAAKRRIVVVTTCARVASLPPWYLPVADRKAVFQVQRSNLELLQRLGVPLAIGSDMTSDTSLKEFEYLRSLGIFDNLTLIKMWTQVTPLAVYPNRKIGALEDGYEASFLALGGDPLENLDNVRKIKLRFKQGLPLD